MNITEQSVIGELVAADYRTASVFKKHKIDFCCNGNRSIAEACDKKQTPPETLIKELRFATQERNMVGEDYAAWPLDLLADYIEKKHHRYVTTKIQEILPYLHKIVRVHGERHPELEEIAYLFAESAEELTIHMEEEEKVLFPLIRKMVQQSGETTQAPQTQNTIQNLMQEHDTEGQRFRRIAALTQDYTPPADACTTYRVSFSLLKEFEEDLHLHIHLENNILFPKSITLEHSLVS